MGVAALDGGKVRATSRKGPLPLEMKGRRERWLGAGPPPEA